MPDRTDPDHPALRLITEVWPLLALGVVGAVILRACVPAHLEAAAAATAPSFDVAAAVRAGNSRATAALNALTPESGSEQALAALNLVVIEFAAGNSTLPDDAEPVLVRVAAVIATRPASERFEISGHTDGTGTPLSDLELSRRRAQAVVDFLVNQGIDSPRLQARGVGDEDPVAGDAGEETRLRNRRLEFKQVP